MTVFESLLNKTFHVARRRRTADGQGGWVIDYVEIDSVRGRMRPVAGGEREAAMIEERDVSHVLYVLAGEDIKRGDLVSPGALIIDGFDVTSATGDLIVEVLGVRDPSLAGEHLEIDCQERQFEQSVEAGS